MIRVEAVRPQTPADILNRKTGLIKPVIKLVPDRSHSANTKGQWRRVIAPLDAVAWAKAEREWKGVLTLAALRELKKGLMQRLLTKAGKENS